jgi:excisionase family DNA binding protein
MDTPPIDPIEAIRRAVDEAVPRRAMFGTDAVCEVTDMGSTWVRERIASGELEAIRVGRRRLVTREALIEFLVRLQHQAAA